MLEVSGGDTLWTHAAQLQAMTVDALQWANHQRAGGKGPKPKPIKRPGVGSPDKQFGSARTREEIDDLLAKHIGPRRRR